MLQSSSFHTVAQRKEGKKEGRKEGRKPVKRESQQLLFSDSEDGVSNLCRKVGNLSMNLHRPKCDNIHFRQYSNLMSLYICET